MYRVLTDAVTDSPAHLLIKISSEIFGGVVLPEIAAITLRQFISVPPFSRAPDRDALSSPSISLHLRLSTSLHQATLCPRVVNMPPASLCFIPSIPVPFTSPSTVLTIRRQHPQTHKNRRRVHTTLLRHVLKATTPTPNSTPPSNDDGQPNIPPPPAGHPHSLSRTLVGRVLVEIFSLLMGAFLLLLVLLSRLANLVFLNFVRLLSWLSGVRQLGKWALSRLSRPRPIALPVISLRHIFSRALFPTSSSDTTIVDVAPTPTSTSVKSNPVPIPNPPVPSRPPGRRLILLRHANTLWDRHADTPDHDRVLSTKGKAEARVVGIELARLFWIPDVVLCSDAVRTVQTLSLLDMPDSHTPNTTCTEALYYAVTGEEMAAAVDEALTNVGFRPDDTVLVVCHNPGCEELVEQLTGRRPEMGTACAALLQCEESDQSLPTATDFSMTSTSQSKWSLVELIQPSNLMSSQPSQNN